MNTEKSKLLTLLSPHTVRAHYKAKRWEEAIRAGGNLLVRVGAVTENYVQGMVDGMKTLGPYIVIAPGIAMPHARPEAGAKRLGVSLVTLKEPIPFGNVTNDPVSLVFCLAATDEASHLSLMAEWVRLLQDKNKVQRLREAETEGEILAVIKELEVK